MTFFGDASRTGAAAGAFLGEGSLIGAGAATVTFFGEASRTGAASGAFLGDAALAGAGAG